VPEAAAADWVLLLAGRVVAAGPPDEVLTGPQLERAYGVAFRAEGGRMLIDDAHRSRVVRHRGVHPRSGPDVREVPG
jgi:ABC-type hemin transport system ATPase subunit